MKCNVMCFAILQKQRWTGVHGHEQCLHGGILKHRGTLSHQGERCGQNLPPSRAPQDGVRF